MANIVVAGDQYYELDGQLSEIKRQLRQSNGYPFDPLQLKAHLQAAIEGRFVTGNFKYDKRKNGWTLLENTPRRISSAIEAVSFLKNESSSYGQEDAEWLLEHQDLIPVELRKFYLVFPATKWRNPDGRRSVSFLYWGGGRWVLGFGWLGVGFYGYGRLVRPRK